MPKPPESVKLGNNSTHNAHRTFKLPKHISQMGAYPVGEAKLYQISFDASVRRSFNAEIIKLDFSRCYRAAHALYEKFCEKICRIKFSVYLCDAKRTEQSTQNILKPRYCGVPETVPIFGSVRLATKGAPLFLCTYIN